MFTPPAIVAPAPGWSYPAIAPYADIIQEYGQAYHIRPDIIAAVILTESDGQADAKVKAGKGLWAVGLMQIIAKGPGFKERPTVEDLRLPRMNISWGVRIMKWFSLDYPTVWHVMYHYSGGTAWGSHKCFEDTYLSRLQDKYHLLWGRDLDSAESIEIPRKTKRTTQNDHPYSPPR